MLYSKLARKILSWILKQLLVIMSNLDWAVNLGLTKLVTLRDPVEDQIEVMGFTFSQCGRFSGRVWTKMASEWAPRWSGIWSTLKWARLHRKAQPGNPKPRLFPCLIPAEGVINRMGFNNGVDEFWNICTSTAAFQTVAVFLGSISVKMQSHRLDELRIAIWFVAQGLQPCRLHRDQYFSPNTKNLRSLRPMMNSTSCWRRSQLSASLSRWKRSKYVPIALKIALGFAEKRWHFEISDQLVQLVDAIIATNTTISHWCPIQRPTQ